MQSGGVPENVPLAVHILCPSPLVSLYPVSQVYVTEVLKLTVAFVEGVAWSTVSGVHVTTAKKQ